ncbi:hypothetical protein HanRHA438_Chr15g0733231 [Helianthus annuus]|nr:hypothetical protein HanRHA438_Chr15g0733231 [Helianthus annuus]
MLIMINCIKWYGYIDKDMLTYSLYIKERVDINITFKDLPKIHWEGGDIQCTLLPTLII